MNNEPGWYSQPDGSQRYWDGSSWVGNPIPAPPGQAAPPAAVDTGPRPGNRRVWGITAAAIAVVVLLGAVAAWAFLRNAAPVPLEAAPSQPSPVAPTPLPSSTTAAAPTCTSLAFDLVLAHGFKERSPFGIEGIDDIRSVTTVAATPPEVVACEGFAYWSHSVVHGQPEEMPIRFWLKYDDAGQGTVGTESLGGFRIPDE